MEDLKAGSQEDLRREQLQNWARGKAGEDTVDLRMVSGDASFRRYFRLELTDRSLIAVDAPPEHEDNPRFIKVCELLRAAGVHAPEVLARDLEQGFLLLEDLGDALYLDALLLAQQQQEFDKADELYKSAIDALIQFQKSIKSDLLDPFDSKELQREMHLFDEWFCKGFLELELDESERSLIAATYNFLEQAALSQTQVAVHRDYHSRNLLVTKPNPGIIDFQDAVSGAYTYDLVSLLRDCYIRWEDPQLNDWLRYYHEHAAAAGIIPALAEEQLQRDFDLMGLQRHLKVMGIFCRLFIRDKKSRYLADIPLVMNYFLDVAGRYPELQEFVVWFQRKIEPAALMRLANN